MTIRNFVEGYKNRIDVLKEQYIKDNLKITTYVPFIKKVTYATTLAQSTMMDKETGNVKISSESNYLFFVRSIIELYTDLEIENYAFYDEYDLLNESGLLDKIMQTIPEKEIGEFKMLCDIKQKDLITNQYEMHSYISNQVTRFGELIGVTLKPIMEKISEQLENMDEKDIDKIAKALERGLKRVK